MQHTLLGITLIEVLIGERRFKVPTSHLTWYTAHTAGLHYTSQQSRPATECSFGAHACAPESHGLLTITELLVSFNLAAYVEVKIPSLHIIH